jgi:phage head maturation protease
MRYSLKSLAKTFEIFVFVHPKAFAKSLPKNDVKIKCNHDHITVESYEDEIEYANTRPIR